MRREEIEGIAYVTRLCQLYCRDERTPYPPFGDPLCASCAKKIDHIVSGEAYREAVERGDIIFVPAVPAPEVPKPRMSARDIGRAYVPRVYGKPPKF